MAELDGRPVTLDEMQALALTNYGSFTTLRVEGRRVRGLGLHLERLADDCRALFGVGLDQGYVRGLMRRMAPPEGTATIRVTVFDPATDLGRPEHAPDPHVLVTRRPAGPLPLPALSVKSARYERDVPGVKNVGLFGALWHRRAARLDGFDDVLFVDDRGAISEGCTWNIGFYDDGGIVWPAAKALPGVTMRLLQTHHPHRTAEVRPADLPAVRAAFATNAAIGVRAVTRIDDTEFPAAHPILDTLREEYAALPGEPL